MSAFDTLPPVTGAAVVTAFTMYPVDIVRALVMAQASGERAGVGALVSNFYKAHGAKGFIMQGIGPEMARATFSRVIKFWAQPIAHQKIFGMKQSEGNAVTKGLAGAIATVPEVLAISPFENVKLAEQLDKEKKFKGTSDVFRHLRQTRGVIGGYYIGYFGMQIRQMLWTGGYFMSLDVYRSICQNSLNKGEKSLLTDTAAGFLAGVTGVCLNCWTDVVRTAIQKEAVAQTFDTTIPRPRVTPAYLCSGVTSVMGKTMEIYSSRGIAGLYAGFAVKSVYLGGSGALLAVLVPRFKAMWGCASD